MSTDKIVQDLLECKAMLATATAAKARLEAELAAALQEQIQSQLVDKEYGTGTATVDVAGRKVKFIISKKASYDQEGLRAVYADLQGRGENPDEYIKVKFDVSESAYKNWPSSLQKLFQPYRTVEPSKPTVTIE